MDGSEVVVGVGVGVVGIVGIVGIDTVFAESIFEGIFAAGNTISIILSILVSSIVD